jgi:hypothetical protein
MGEDVRAVGRSQAELFKDALERILGIKSPAALRTYAVARECLDDIANGLPLSFQKQSTSGCGWFCFASPANNNRQRCKAELHYPRCTMVDKN